MLEPVKRYGDTIQSQRNGCGFLMLARLMQIECAQGFVHLMYNLLEMLGKVMEFMLSSRSAGCGDGQRLLPVHALSPLMQVRAYRRRWTYGIYPAQDVLVISIQQGVHPCGARSE